MAVPTALAMPPPCGGKGGLAQARRDPRGPVRAHARSAADGRPRLFSRRCRPSAIVAGGAVTMARYGRLSGEDASGRCAGQTSAVLPTPCDCSLRPCGAGAGKRNIGASSCLGLRPDAVPHSCAEPRARRGAVRPAGHAGRCGPWRGIVTRIYAPQASPVSMTSSRARSGWSARHCRMREPDCFPTARRPGRSRRHRPDDERLPRQGAPVGPIIVDGGALGTMGWRCRFAEVVDDIVLVPARRRGRRRRSRGRNRGTGRAGRKSCAASSSTLPDHRPQFASGLRYCSLATPNSDSRRPAATCV